MYKVKCFKEPYILVFIPFPKRLLLQHKYDRPSYKLEVKSGCKAEYNTDYELS